MVKAVEDQRNDPVLREGVKRLMAKRTEECSEVMDLLARALEITRDWYDDPLMDKDGFYSVTSMRGSLGGLHDKMQHEVGFLPRAGETYVGNVAAFLTPEQAAAMWSAV